MGEQPLELGVDHVEGGDQPLAAFAVEALDAPRSLRIASMTSSRSRDQRLRASRSSSFCSSSARRLTAPRRSRSIFSRSSSRLDLARIRHRLRRAAGPVKAQRLMRRDVQRLADACLALVPLLAGRTPAAPRRGRAARGFRQVPTARSPPCGRRRAAASLGLRQRDRRPRGGPPRPSAARSAARGACPRIHRGRISSSSASSRASSSRSRRVAM